MNDCVRFSSASDIPASVKGCVMPALAWADNTARLLDDSRWVAFLFEGVSAILYDCTWFSAYDGFRIADASRPVDHVFFFGRWFTVPQQVMAYRRGNSLIIDFPSGDRDVIGGACV